MPFASLEDFRDSGLVVVDGVGDGSYIAGWWIASEIRKADNSK